MALDHVAALTSFIIKVTEILLVLEYSKLKSKIFMELTKYEPSSTILLPSNSRISLLSKLLWVWFYFVAF